MTSPVDSILHQSPLHLINSALVLSVLFISVWQAFTLRVLSTTLRSEGAMLLEGTHHAHTMLHPIAKAMLKMAAAPAAWNATTLRRAVELYEATVFIPFRAKLTLVRDWSTLVGLIATCSALVTAGADFARHGRAELLVGSVAAGTVATCLAAVGCALSLWNLSRLTQLRVRVASEIEDWLLEPLQVREFTVPVATPATTAAPATPTTPTTPAPAPEPPATPTNQEEVNYAI